MRKDTMPSGAVLEVGIAPFAVAKALYQAVLRELRHISIGTGKPDMAELWKDVFCVGFASNEIEEAIKPCLARCLYDGEKITDASFEPEDRRQDYMQVLMEVAKDNIGPFAKALFATWKKASFAAKASTSPESTPAS